MTLTEQDEEPLVGLPVHYNTFVDASTIPQAAGKNDGAYAEGTVVGFRSNKQSPNSTPTPPTQSQLVPTLMMFLASVLFSAMQACVRHTTTNFPVSPIFVVWFRGCLQATAAVVLIFMFREHTLADRLSTPSIAFLFVRGLLGAISILSKYTALSLIPVAIASSLFSTTPVFAVLLGWLFLREAPTIVDRIVLAVTTVASVLIGVSQNSVADLPGGDSQHISGVLLALNGGLMTSAVLVLMKHMGTRVHFLFSVFAMGIGSAVAAIALYSVQKGSVGTTLKDFIATILMAERGAWIGLSGVFGFGFASALCANRSAQLLSPGRSGMIRTFDIPNTFVIGYLFLGEFPHAPGQLIGCALIAISMLLLTTNAFQEVGPAPG